MADNEGEGFEPLVVLQFSSTTRDNIKEWVLERLTAKRGDDQGAELLARFDDSSASKNDILVIGATTNRLLIGAEELRFKKRDKNKRLTEFLLSDFDRFENSENPENFLLKSEKQRIIWEEIQNLHPKSSDHSVPGEPTKLITPQTDNLIDILRDLKYLDDIFPLHDKEELKILGHDWFKTKYSILKVQDIHKIRDYFGDNVAFYFAFVEYYTFALIPTAVFALLVTFWTTTDFYKYSLFSIFNVIWWTVFMELWKRYTNRLAYAWGTLDMEVFERPRPSYYGDLKLSPITNKMERQYPSFKRTLKKYLISYPLIVICIAISLSAYFTYYGIQASTNQKYPFDGSILFIKAKAMRMVPTIGYSLLIGQVNGAYKKLATYLTNFENHRLQTTFENNLTAKLFIFFFVNCFAGLFYEAFINANYGNVTQLLISLVIANAIILKFTEQIAPYIMKSRKTQQTERRSVDTRVSEAVRQLKTLTPFEGTYGDYLTIFEQYGYVALFSAVFPWVAICAFINNIFEIGADSLKYRLVYRRPFAKPAANIGSWHYAFDVLSSIAIVTNTALIAMQPSVREYFSSYSDIQYILIFIGAEHILLAIKFVIDFAIPDVPKEVQIERIKNMYESNQALRRQRTSKS